MDAVASFDPMMARDAMQASPEAALAMTRSSKRDPAAIDRAAQDFESMFLSQMLEHMFSDVRLGGAEPGEEESTYEIYRSMLVGEYGKLMSQAGGIGVADFVKREMLRAQEVGA